MDFDLRQWLLILGPVFIIGVLLHGYLRMRAGQNDIRMKLDRDFLSRSGDEPDLDDLNLLRAELPNGGARVIRADESEDVPVLMEPVDVPSVSVAEPEQQELLTPAISAAEPDPLLEPLVDEIPKAPPAKKAPPARTPEPPETESNLETTGPESDGPDPASGDSPELASGDSRELASGDSPELASRESDSHQADNVESQPKPEKFVVVHVLALDAHFNGQSLLELLLGAGMTFGEMDIFHKLDDTDQPQFSLASAVEPGTFDMATIDQFSTPGVTLFMRVHELVEPVTVLDEMLGVAESIALELGGEVRDETRSVMTPQTIEHCRQSVQEFQFKHSA